MRTCNYICNCNIQTRISHIFRILWHFQNRICVNYASYAKICTSSHISAYVIIIYATYLHIFLRILHQNGLHILRKHFA